jgi:signal transduction histidine kinase/CheY-like chemotaxis protein
MEALFARAEEVVSQYFREREDRPERGTIEIFGERYLLVRGASLSVEFFALVRELYGKAREAESDDFARNILFDLAHAIGKQDAKNFHDKMDLRDPIARLSAGPVHFSHSGWAFVDISPQSRPEPGPDYYLLYDHPYSFESDAWLRAGRHATFPVCIMNAGYSSGWCQESFGLALVATEVLCRARGDETCRFVMAPPAQIEKHVARYVNALPATARSTTYQIPNFFARKRLEEDLRRRFEEALAERKQTEEKLRQAEKLEAVGRLAGGIAHDFNNLMAIVMTRVALLERRIPDGDPMRDELAHILAASERASNLTRQLLAFSRVQVLRRQSLEVTAVVRDLASLLDVLLGETYELELSLSEETGWIEADRGQLEQVIANLVVNARDAMPRGGTISLATSRRRFSDPPAHSDLPRGTYVVIEVTDRGHGMDEATLARIFEPFFTTKPEEGAGLGLATVYGIVKQSGGHVMAMSEVGVGTRFTVMLPAAQPAESSETTERPQPERLEVSRPRILLVEDNASVRLALVAYLGEEGYEVISAADADEAIRISSDPSVAIDVLLSDVVLPRIGGRELALALQRTRPQLRVLFMSGYSPDTSLLDGFVHASWLAKPFKPEALVDKLHELVRT